MAADASLDDAERAIAAARRAFDTTEWSRDPRVPFAMPAPAARGAAGQLRTAERDPRAGGGRAGFDHQRCAAQRADRRRALACRSPRALRVRRGPRQPRGLRAPEPPVDREGGRRRRRCDHRVQLPDPARPREARTVARRRLHRGAQGRARYAVGNPRTRQAHRGGDRHPARCRERDHVVGQRGRRVADDAPRHRRRVVHRFDAGRARNHGGGERHAEAVVPRARRQVGVRAARRRRRFDGRHVHRVRGDLALRSGLRDHVAPRGAA